MYKKNYKGRCEKKSLSKCDTICRCYSTIQSVYADKLQTDPSVQSFNAMRHSKMKTTQQTSLSPDRMVRNMSESVWNEVI